MKYKDRAQVWVSGFMLGRPAKTESEGKKPTNFTIIKFEEQRVVSLDSAFCLSVERDDF